MWEKIRKVTQHPYDAFCSKVKIITWKSVRVDLCSLAWPMGLSQCTFPNSRHNFSSPFLRLKIVFMFLITWFSCLRISDVWACVCVWVPMESREQPWSEVILKDLQPYPLTENFHHGWWGNNERTDATTDNLGLVVCALIWRSPSTLETHCAFHI